MPLGNSCLPLAMGSSGPLSCLRPRIQHTALLHSASTEKLTSEQRFLWHQARAVPVPVRRDQEVLPRNSVRLRFVSLGPCVSQKEVGCRRC